MRVEPSIFRDDRAPELEVKADRHSVVGGLGGVGNLPVRREWAAGTVVTIEVGEAVFDLGKDVVGDRVGDTAAAGQAVGVDRELVSDRETRNLRDSGVGMLNIAEGVAAGEEQQQAVDHDATSGEKCAAPAKIIRIDRGDAGKG